MFCRRRVSAIAASLMLAASAQAVEANFQLSELPSLSAEPQHETASKRVTSRFTRSHYKQFALDDAFSAAIFDRYLETLDYNRVFLTQDDVERLSRWKTRLDDQLKEGETQAAYAIYNRVLKKRFERYQYALHVLDKPFDFSADESMVLDRTELPWAANEAELDAIWDKRVKNDALNLRLTGKEDEEIRETLGKRYNSALKRLTQSHSEDVFQVYMNAFAREVDPHTSYLSPRNAEQFQSEMNLSLEGIGAVLQIKNEYTVIRSLVAGGPASKSKQLSPGDRIIGVGQEDEAIVDVIGWRLDDVVELIKGPKGSEVKLKILPEGANAKSYNVTLTRDKIRLEDRAVKSEVIERGDEKVGVLTVPGFYVGLADDTKKEIASLKEKGISGIVVDLRNNGGGALSEATALSGLFIDQGPIVQVRDSYGRVKVNSDTDGKRFYDGPMTVLINRYSASASEIFAAAMQDYERAVVIGEQSFGKGTVQQHRSLNHIYDLFDKPLGYVQYTIQKFYRISGGSTQNKGVVPDIVFPSPVSPDETGESVEENALPWDRIEKADYQPRSLPDSVLNTISEKHKARIKDDREFDFIRQDIARYQEEKDKNTISLNEDARRKEMEREDQERLARLNVRQKALGEPPFKTLDDVPKDYEEPDAYLDEAASITKDLANLLSANR
ncbi:MULTISPECIES: carboxy terminal-processing peptidase [unclassified Salinivibrio]|uniref:carboxy terminal-processing peptidase n=1 Tax=unclassified Salinivibrio TaxID=2636825 RepID=UPI00128BAF59|nr:MULTISPECIES: carboxy terminal-processing peptidase [unclassified Salinivibrio]MPS31591.1 carboxy terminal-processing peptidase [Salinivibrio sp. VYel7]MPX90161.1 carboxy terminal-processing peptidase [Salinivibrio sp. VYel1]MPX92986.1 carboxy terminal-processing peptidase [Salinivibrio sp. VYel9]MPX95330.1 carboxy terminal-processing peptidase [Salinivibrio sp. VYel6]MPX99204.1 carboxy terminal-processing peptidase [Salinivibrio sp. VYel4]